MSIPCPMLIARRGSIVGAALTLCLGMAQAQILSSVRSSVSDPTRFDLKAFGHPSSIGLFAVASTLSRDTSASTAGAGPYDSNSGGAGRHYAWVGGGGFNVPIGNDGPYISWGGNFTGGGGIHLSRGFSVLGEFSFFDNKLPDSFVAAGGGQGGNTKIIALTIDPIFDLFPSSKNSAYLVGGGGYYHKSTNFTVQQCCDFYGYPVNLNVSSFSSSQGGLNFGFGLTHRLGGVYGDGQMKIFGEARYTWINTPKIGETNGLGRTELIPVTFGVRW